MSREMCKFIHPRQFHMRSQFQMLNIQHIFLFYLVLIKQLMFRSMWNICKQYPFLNHVNVIINNIVMAYLDATQSAPQKPIALQYNLYSRLAQRVCWIAVQHHCHTIVSALLLLSQMMMADANEPTVSS